MVLEVRATPGHTPESISTVVWEHEWAEPWAVLTGDTLFVGDVGRPDLLASTGASPKHLARQLYRSLHGRLLTLPDRTRVFPAHGAGSACGRAMSSTPSSTIGEQRRTNYALAPMSEDDFVAAVATDQPMAPAYFPFAASTNRRSHPVLDDHDIPASLSFDQVIRYQRDGAVIIDGRSPQAFASGHLRGSINIGLEGCFADYAGDVVGPDQPMILITDPGRELEAKNRLARIGFDHVLGCLPAIDAVLAQHPDQAARASRIPVADVARWITSDPDVQLVDARNPSEQEAGTIPGARPLPLHLLRDNLGDLSREGPTVVFRASGNRSSTAASLLRSSEFAPVVDVLGGFDAWAAAGLPTTRPGD